MAQPQPFLLLDRLRTGLFWDPDLKLHFSTTRALDPATGQWLNRDLTGELGGAMFYTDFGLPKGIYEAGLTGYSGGMTPVVRGWNAVDIEAIRSNRSYTSAQTNLYAYLDGDPLNYTDPTGRAVGLVGGFIAGCLIGAAGAGAQPISKNAAKDMFDGPEKPSEYDYKRARRDMLGEVVMGCVGTGVAGAVAGATFGAGAIGGIGVGAGIGFGIGVGQGNDWW